MDLDRLPCRQWEEAQQCLAQRVSMSDDEGFEIDQLKRVGGVDVSFQCEGGNHAAAALAVLSFPSLETLHVESIDVDIDIPYIPGFLAFREEPVVSRLVASLSSELMPDVLLCDGNGILHPRSAGLAVHVGVINNLRTIGVGKKLFRVDGIGLDKAEAVVGPARKALKGRSGRVWGEALWTTPQVTNPIYVSIGNRLSLDSAVDIVLRCSRFRVPEPIRVADHHSRRMAATSS